MASASDLVKALTSGHSAEGFSGATTCSPFAARGLHERVETRIDKALADLLRGIEHRRPRHVLTRIEIQDDDVGPLPVGNRRPPGVDLQGGRLNEAHHSVQIADADPGILIRIGRIGDGHDVGVQALPGVLLEKPLALNAAWAAKKGQRATDDIGGHEPPYVGVKVREAFLGDPLVGPIEPVGMGELDRAALGLRRLGLDFRHLADDVARRLVFAKPPERGVPEMPIGGPGPKLDLRHQLRTNVSDASPLVGRHGVVERLFLRAQPLQPGLQGLGDLGAEACSDPTDVLELALLEHAEGQRADGLARDRRRHVSADDELLPRRALRLDPGFSPPRTIGGIAPLADDALKAQSASVLQHHGAAFVEMRTEADNAPLREE